MTGQTCLGCGRRTATTTRGGLPLCGDCAAVWDTTTGPRPLPLFTGDNPMTAAAAPADGQSHGWIHRWVRHSAVDLVLWRIYDDGHAELAGVVCDVDARRRKQIKRGSFSLPVERYRRQAADPCRWPHWDLPAGSSKIRPPAEALARQPLPDAGH